MLNDIQTSTLDHRITLIRLLPQRKPSNPLIVPRLIIRPHQVRKVHFLHPKCSEIEVPKRIQQPSCIYEPPLPCLPILIIISTAFLTSPFSLPLLVLHKELRVQQRGVQLDLGRPLRTQQPLLHQILSRDDAFLQ